MVERGDGCRPRVNAGTTPSVLCVSSPRGDGVDGFWPLVQRPIGFPAGLDRGEGRRPVGGQRPRVHLLQRSPLAMGPLLRPPGLGVGVDHVQPLDPHLHRARAGRLPADPPAPWDQGVHRPAAPMVAPSAPAVRPSRPSGCPGRRTPRSPALRRGAGAASSCAPRRPGRRAGRSPTRSKPRRTQHPAGRVARHPSPPPRRDPGPGAVTARRPRPPLARPVQSRRPARPDRPPVPPGPGRRRCHKPHRARACPGRRRPGPATVVLSGGRTPPGHSRRQLGRTGRRPSAWDSSRHATLLPLDSTQQPRDADGQTLLQRSHRKAKPNAFLATSPRVRLAWSRTVRLPVARRRRRPGSGVCMLALVGSGNGRDGGSRTAPECGGTQAAAWVVGSAWRLCCPGRGQPRAVDLVR